MKKMTMVIVQKDELNSIVASRSGTPCHPMVNLVSIVTRIIIIVITITITITWFLSSQSPPHCKIKIQVTPLMPDDSSSSKSIDILTNLIFIMTRMIFSREALVTQQ